MKQPWKKICCAIDFSARTGAVMAVAAELARAFDAELLLVHAEGKPREESALYAHPEVADSARRHLEQRLEERRVAASDLCGGPVSATLLPGHAPAETIAEFAEREKCGLIVVGAHEGRAVFEKLPEKLTRIARCSVLAVRD